MNPKSKHNIAVLVLIMLFLSFSWSVLHADTIFQQVGIASSPNPVGSGARAVGMGGAFIAVADDATAASWNPSGLIQLEKPEISLVGAYFNRREKFSSDQHPESNNTGDVDGSNLNYFSVTYPFHFLRNMVVSINYQRLLEFERSFDHQYDYSPLDLDLYSSKRFSQEGSLGALGLAGAVEIAPSLSFGATLNIWENEFFGGNGWKENYSELAVGTVGGAPVTFETHIVDEYTNFRGFNANLGLLWDVNEHLTVGAVVKTPFDATIRHEFNFTQVQTFGDPINQTVPSRQIITEHVELRIPASYGMGLAWRFSDELTIDLDVYRTEWSKYILTDSQGNQFSPIDGRPRSESDVDDTTQVRLGGEYLFIKPERDMVIPVRGGLFYDPQPSEGSPEDFYGLSLGSGIAYKRFVFDAAYQLRWGRDVDTGNLVAYSKADIMQHNFLASIIIHF